MNPSPEDVFKLISSQYLGKVLRGEECVFLTPADINDDMRPTDHDELLERAIYPLAQQHGMDKIQGELENAIQEICFDALGVFCAIQCFYIQIVREDAQASPLKIDRKNLPKFLAASFLKESDALHSLEVKKGDLSNDRSYKVTLSGMRILARDHGINWGVVLP